MKVLNFEKDFAENPKLRFYKKNYRIGLDIDEVVADFVNGYLERYGERTIKNFYFSYNTGKNLTEELIHDKEFWLNLKPLIKNEELPFHPTCYISRRDIPISWTEEWIEKNHLPCVPVIHVSGDKGEACKKMKIDKFIDDSMTNFQSLNSQGIETYLFDAMHNRQYDVGEYRLKHLNELILKV